MRRGANLAVAAGFLVAMLGASHVAAQSAATPASVRVEAPSCAASWFDREAFERALSVELVQDAMRVDVDGAIALALEVPCGDDADAIVTLAIDRERRTVSLIDLAPAVRMRALALAGRDFVGEVVARASSRREIPESEPVHEPPRIEHEAVLLAPPTRPRPPRAELEVEAPPASPAQRWLAIVISARAMWLGLRVIAPSLSVEGEARVLGTPLVIWLALDGLYAFGSDGLGEVRAFDVGARAGARAVLELAPVALSLSVGVLGGYARAEGVSTSALTRAGAIDGGLIGIDVAASASVAVTSEVRLLLSIGFVGYLLGFEARAEGRPILSFRDVAPWASLGVGIDLPAM